MHVENCTKIVSSMKKNFDPLSYLHSIRLIHLSLNGHRVFKTAFENKRHE